MKNKNKIINDLKFELVKQFGNDIKSVILFGSHAWGTPSVSSDYDILIVLNTVYDWKTERLISNICYAIDLKYDVITDTHILSDYELHNTIKGADPLFVNALNKGIYA